MSNAPSAGEPHHQLSRLIAAGKVREATELAAGLCEREPGNAELWYTLADLYAQQGVMDRVIHCCEQVLAINPGHPGARYNLAVAALQCGNVQKAESGFRACLEIEPGSLPALMGLGRLLSDQGRHDEAARYFGAAADGHPGHAEASFCLGVALQAQQQHGPAGQAYQRALAARPDYVEALNNLGSLLSDMGRLQESLEVFDRLLQVRSDLPLAYNNIGIVYEGMGRTDEAEAAYRQAIQLDSDMNDAATHLGYLLADSGRTGEALDMFDRVLDRAPGHEPAVAGKAVALEKIGEFDAAEEVIGPVISAGSNDPDSVLACGRVMMRTGRLQEAIRLVKPVLEGGELPVKARSDLHFMLGDLYDKSGEYAAAFSNYRSANDVLPFSFDMDAHIAYIDRIIGATDSASLERLPLARETGNRMLFIVGMPRSGTSLVEQILASHADVFGAGELRNLSDLAASMLPGSPEASSYPDALYLLGQEDVNRMARSYLDVVDALVSTESVVTDKMPHNFLYLGLLSRLFPDARILHVRRTPLDNCLSLYFHSFNPMHAYTTDLEMLGRYYREYQRLMSHWADVIDDRIIDVSYEDIAGTPDEAIRKLLAVCGLDWSEACLAFHESGRFVSTPSYDQVRQPIYTSSVDRWKNYEPYIEQLRAALAG